MSKTAWKAFPHPDPAYTYAGTALKKHWARLHQGDVEPWPTDSAAQAAWRAYHAGEFAQAVALGLKATRSHLRMYLPWRVKPPDWRR